MRSKRGTDRSQCSSNLNTSSTSRLKYAAILSINSADGARSPRSTLLIVFVQNPVAEAISSCRRPRDSRIVFKLLTTASSDPLVVSRSRGIRIKPLNDRSYESEAELCHFGIMFESFSIFAHGKDLLLMFFFIIRGEQAGIHPMVVWSEDRNIRSKHFLMVLFVF